MGGITEKFCSLLTTVLGSHLSEHVAFHSHLLFVKIRVSWEEFSCSKNQNQRQASEVTERIFSEACREHCKIENCPESID